MKMTNTGDDNKNGEKSNERKKNSENNQEQKRMKQTKIWRCYFNNVVCKRLKNATDENRM